MRRGALRISWYRFWATFSHRWGGYLSLVLLIGLVGGLSMGGFAAARRTQASFSTFLASTNPSAFIVSIYGAAVSSTAGPNYAPDITKGIAHLPHVHRVGVGVLLNTLPLAADGAPLLGSLGKVYPIASVNGLFFDQDRVTVIQGRMADPVRPNEFVMTKVAAQLSGFHVGQVIPYGLYTNLQQTLPGFGTPSVRPNIRIEAKLVGLVAFNSQIVQDDIDRLPTFSVFTPALAREVLADSKNSLAGSATYGIQVDGSGNVATVERELARLVPRGSTLTLHATGPVAAKADRAVKPIAIALGMFGAVALVAVLLIATQAIARRLRESTEELTVLRALGADPATTMADGLIGILGAVVLGSILAVLVAVAISPIAPLGPVRLVYPTKGFSADWMVLGVGLLVLIGGLGAIAVAFAYRAAPHRVAQRVRLAPPTGSRVVQTVTAAGLPAPGVVGVRMALESGRGRTAVPVRSALVGTALAVALVVATVTFGSSLQTLVKHPALYGWNWTYMLNQVGAGSAGVPPQTLTALQHDPDVEAATGVNYTDVEIDGQNVPVLFGVKGASITPPILSGHALDQTHEIVLGAGTLAQLHKRMGDTVVLTYGSPKDAPIYIPPTRLTIVGTATMPAVGFASVVSDHTSMGTGALIPFDVIPADFSQAVNSQYPTLDGPNLALVRLRPGVSPAAGRANLQRMADAANRDFNEVPGGAGVGNTIVVQGVQRPAEIVNYRTVGAVPALLAAGLALGAVAALALTLAASVRRRRRDLALLKTLGFTQRQLATAVAWHASVSAVVGVVVGVPVGVILGRWFWDLFARQIYAVPEPTVPVVWVALVAVGALVLANIVAAIPARIAARTPTALMLRAE
jgi:MacB-like periplasmic core domain/FtsX-like permease family